MLPCGISESHWQGRACAQACFCVRHIAAPGCDGVPHAVRDARRAPSISPSS